MTSATPTNLTDWSTEKLKSYLVDLTKGRDRDSLTAKNKFLKQELMPFFEELSRRNPYPEAQAQMDLVVGTWIPIWSTIPFQDIFPGRSRSQSYQIFHDNGYYANLARYSPGQKLPVLRQLASMLISWDLMIIQSYEVQEDHWYIENVGIEQTIRFNAIPLSAEKAESWFTKVSKKYTASDPSKTSIFKKMNKKRAKRLETTYHAKPKLEHLYIDPDFRLVRSKREEKQRDSYTITVRK